MEDFDSQLDSQLDSKSEFAKVVQLLLETDLNLNHSDSQLMSSLTSLPLDEEQIAELVKAQEGLRLIQQAINADRENSTNRPAPDGVSDEAPIQSDRNSFEVDHQPKTPSSLGRFRIEKVLGKGGFGVVYLAEDPRLGRNVALKVPNKRALGNDDAMARFVREAKAAAMLGHPHIVPIYESGTIGAIKYIAFDYCPGPSLAQLIAERGALPHHEAAEIAATLADALQHAHARGVVHRDLKPSNILFDSTIDSFGSAVKITDFGLSKTEQLDDTITRTGATIGTPAYMSPEQARGQLESIGPASDVYSLGAILYEMLSGRPPFREENNLLTLRAVEKQAPVALSSINSAIPIDLQAICGKCLEKEPNARYATAQWLADDLNRFLRGEQVVARPATSTEKAWRWCKRNPGVAIGSALIFGTLLASTILTALFWNHSVANEKVAQDRLRQSREHAQQLRFGIDRLLTAVAMEPEVVGSGREGFRKALLESSRELYAQMREEKPDDHELLVEYCQTVDRIASVYAKMGNIVDARPMLVETLELLENRLPNEMGMQAKMLSYLSLVARDEGDLPASLDYAEQGIKLRKNAHELHPNSTSYAFQYLNDLLKASADALRNGQLGKAKQWNAAGMLVLAQLPSENSDLWQSRFYGGQVSEQSARIAYQESRLDNALQDCQAAIELFQDVDSYPIDIQDQVLYRRSRALSQLYKIQFQKGDANDRYETATAARQTMLELTQRHPENSRYALQRFYQEYIWLSQHSFHTKNWLECERMAEEVIEQLDEVLTQTPSMRIGLLAQKSSLVAFRSKSLNMLGDHEAASELANQAVAIKRELCEARGSQISDRLGLAESLEKKAQTLEALGARAEALIAMNECIRLYEDVVIPGNRRDLLNNLLQRFNTALVWASKSEDVGVLDNWYSKLQNLVGKVPGLENAPLVILWKMEMEKRRSKK